MLKQQYAMVFVRELEQPKTTGQAGCLGGGGGGTIYAASYVKFLNCAENGKCV